MVQKADTVMEYLKVSSKSSPSSVAGAIAGMIKDGVPVEIQSVGAGAVNQAVKAVAIARGFLSPVGIEIVCAPAFADISINGESRTAIRFTVEPRYLRGTKKGELGEDAKFDWVAYGANFSES
jgi:stage V sporulation protein S